LNPLIVTVAAVGAELSLERQPNLPSTPDALARDAEQCRDAGASIYHLHVRDARGRPTMDVEAFSAARDAIVRSSDLIVQFTSGGGVNDPEEARIAPLELRPEMATLTTGTVNFGDEVFLNRAPFVSALYQRMRELGILPEFEIFDAGMLAGAEQVMAAHGDGHHLHYDFVLGVPGGMPAWNDSVEWLASKLPEGATWSATGIGRAHAGVAKRSIELGGNVRTGFEDVRYVGPGELASSNAQLVGEVVEMARASGRPIATPDETRELLGLSGPHPVR
jgi:3-keto-5-aminohexanoate cleavage enzyme